MSKSADAQIKQQQAAMTLTRLPKNKKKRNIRLGKTPHLELGGAGFTRNAGYTVTVVSFEDQVAFLMQQKGYDYAGMSAYMQKHKFASFGEAVNALYCQERREK